jgi:hypothetical protein
MLIIVMREEKGQLPARLARAPSHSLHFGSARIARFDWRLFVSSLN